MLELTESATFSKFQATSRSYLSDFLADTAVYRIYTQYYPHKREVCYQIFGSNVSRLWIGPLHASVRDAYLLPFSMRIFGGYIMADDHSVEKSYECPFCRKQTRHVPISVEEFGDIFIPRTDRGYKPWRCCECGAVCQRQVNDDQPGKNAYYLKNL